MSDIDTPTVRRWAVGQRVRATATNAYILGGNITEGTLGTITYASDDPKFQYPYAVEYDGTPFGSLWTAGHEIEGVE